MAIVILLCLIAVILNKRLARTQMLVTPTQEDASKIQEHASNIQMNEALQHRIDEITMIEQEIKSKISEIASASRTSDVEVPSVTGLEARVERALSGIDFLASHFKIATEVTKYGSLIGDAYDNFMTGLTDEFTVLEQKNVTGSEYFYRSNVLLFSLMMARVYMSVYGSSGRLLELDKQIERAKKLV
jgi:hypothetical protein